MHSSKNTNRRIESTKAYIDALSANHSKLNIVRVDLGYEKPHSNTVTIEQANQDIAHMYNNKRSKPSIFKYLVGQVAKKEYTPDRGIHFHALFIFDGQKIQKDTFKGDEIGEYWEQITQGRGSYHNCNRDTYREHGIGMLEHSNNDKRKILDEKVIPYLCKEDQSITAIAEGKKVKALIRGTMPKKKGNRGRPRG